MEEPQRFAPLEINNKYKNIDELNKLHRTLRVDYDELDEQEDITVYWIFLKGKHKPSLMFLVSVDVSERYVTIDLDCGDTNLFETRAESFDEAMEIVKKILPCIEDVKYGKPPIVKGIRNYLI